MQEYHHAMFDRFELTMTDDVMWECSGQGRVDRAVKYWVTAIKWDDINPEDIQDELRKYGAWSDEDLRDEDKNRERILWIAACNVREELER